MYVYANVFGDLKILCSWDKVSEVAYQQNIEGNNSFRMWKCEEFLSSLAPLARIYIDFLNVSVLLVCCCLYRHTTSNKRELHWLYMHTDVLWDLKIYMFLRRSLASLARAYSCLKKIMSVHLGVLPPPPPIPKSWLLYWVRVRGGGVQVHFNLLRCSSRRGVYQYWWEMCFIGQSQTTGINANFISHSFVNENRVSIKGPFVNNYNNNKKITREALLTCLQFN